MPLRHLAEAPSSQARCWQQPRRYHAQSPCQLFHIGRIPCRIPSSATEARPKEGDGAVRAVLGPASRTEGATLRSALLQLRAPTGFGTPGRPHRTAGSNPNLGQVRAGTRRHDRGPAACGGPCVPPPGATRLRDRGRAPGTERGGGPSAARPRLRRRPRRAARLPPDSRACPRVAVVEVHATARAAPRRRYTKLSRRKCVSGSRVGSCTGADACFLTSIV